VALGLSVHAVVAAFGAGTLIDRWPLLYEGLRWCGVAYLLWLAVEGWRGEAETSPASTSLGADGGKLLACGFLSNVFNPKSILFFVSVVPRFLVEGSPVPSQMAVIGALYVAVATAVHAAIVTLAARLSPFVMAGPRRDRARRTLSLLLAGVAIWLAWTTRR
jgi:threonine/homoserine/homoserine lactone efflux protein